MTYFRLARLPLRTLTLSVVLSAFLMTARAQAPADVLVTIAMIGDVVENVAGACANVTPLMGAGVDPHLYEASARDVRLFQESEVIFYSGYSLEGQLGEVLERFGEQKPTVAVAPASIDASNLITVQDIYGIDPHLWMDVSLWAQITTIISDTLAEVRPDCAETMAANAANYREQLSALHAWIAGSIATIPESQRLMVTAHDAFNYYARAYGIDVAGIQGISTESEAGIADIREMATLVAERGVPAVFIETTINPRTIQAVVDAAAEQGHDVVIGEELFSDAMGDEGTPASTYIGMLYTNTVHIVEGLGGEVLPIPDALITWASQWDLTESSP
jgi:manganese/zinc/iron transport system substrate-binding protein